METRDQKIVDEMRRVLEGRELGVIRSLTAQPDEKDILHVALFLESEAEGHVVEEATPQEPNNKGLFGVHIRGVVSAAIFVRADSENGAEDIAHELLLKHVEDNRGPCDTLNLTDAETTDLFEANEGKLEACQIKAANDLDEEPMYGLRDETIGQEAARIYATLLKESWCACSNASACCGACGPAKPDLAWLVDRVISSRVANQMAAKMEAAAKMRQGQGQGGDQK